MNEVFSFAKQRSFFVIFLVCVLIVGLVAIYRLFLSKPTYVYVKVKVGQGLWWANTMRPNTWFVEAIKQAKEEVDLTGQPIAQIQRVRYYRWWGGGQYDTYVTVKLRVSKLGKTGKYNFKRATIGVGTPIDFEFPNVQFSGTIMQLSEKPIIEKYIEKTVYMTKKYAYLWEYDAIPAGDTYFDGKDTVFVLLEKQLNDTNEVMKPDNGGMVNLQQTEQRKYIIVKAKIKIREENGQLIFGEEQIITLGNGFYVVTPRFGYNEYVVARVE
ncbi:hypothetical protein HZC27_05890 [Candidatus Roizmanbacteria bacterium]|nr:hypothetical protein [Candidatus Roizmanbacteria bacterium]